jgi:tetraacyldisaccharide 4'-kinase
MFDLGLLRSFDPKLPVISVGNISLGGTGKTPHVEYLAALLKNEFTVSVLSRGYKRKSRDFGYVLPESLISDTGDEPLQIKSKFPDIIVAVDRNRINGINTIVSDTPTTDVILLDDGFQHRRVRPGFNILLTDFNNLMTRDKLMPYGRLREHVLNKRRADIILVTKCPSELNAMNRRLIVKEINPLTNQHLYFTAYKYLDPVNLVNKEFPGVRLISIKENETHVLLVTGIASPDPLIKYLEEFSSKIIHIRFPDHHNFNNQDISKIREKYYDLPEDNRCLITTEKDAMRLKEIPDIDDILDKNLYYIPIEICFLNEDEIEFNNFVVNYVRKNKSNNKLS